MLRLTRRGRDRYLLGADKSVDGGRFTNVRVTDETDLEFVVALWIEVRKRNGRNKSSLTGIRR
jgi:hypothetical protein